ncbi:MAG: MBL fold metallo-hydrolase [Candidatus Blackburnbacteria bacterium]|nr:MBL fold metallo-hydrolase [Candidatus Blackburnbacteria bacterium]
MDITWLGHSSFRIKGKTSTVITDPYDPSMVGLKFPKIEANIVTISHEHQDHNRSDLVLGAPLSERKLPHVVRGPGEYEIGGVSIFGIPTFHDNEQGAKRGVNTVYVITIDGIVICHLGDLGHKLSEEEARQMGDVDILLVPVGGVYTIDAEDAASIVASIDPWVVIPMHYKIEGGKSELLSQLLSVDKFTKELGLVPLREVKFTVTKESLPQETQLVILELKG